MTKAAQLRDSVTVVDFVGYEDLGFAEHFGGDELFETDMAGVGYRAVMMEGPGIYGG